MAREDTEKLSQCDDKPGVTRRVGAKMVTQQIPTTGGPKTGAAKLGPHQAFCKKPGKRNQVPKKEKHSSI